MIDVPIWAFYSRLAEMLFYLLLIVYAIWDWFKTRSHVRELEIAEVFPGFNKITLSWGLKIFFLYLVVNFIFVLSTHFYFSINEFNEVYLNQKDPSQHSLMFYSIAVTADVVPVTAEQSINPNEEKMGIWVWRGTLPSQSYMALWVNWLYHIIHLIGIVVFYFLVRIFHAFSRVRFFTYDNACWLRGLAWVLFVRYALEWILTASSDWYVKQNYEFQTPQGIGSVTHYDYNVIIICVSLLILAEIIRAGAAMKEEQDLTV